MLLAVNHRLDWCAVRTQNLLFARLEIYPRQVISTRLI
jgi:hypothetical protein